MNHDRHMTFDPSSKIHSKPSSTRRRPWSSSWCGTARASRNPKTGSWNRSSKVWMLIPMTTASPVTPRKNKKRKHGKDGKKDKRNSSSDKSSDSSSGSGDKAHLFLIVALDFLNMFDMFWYMIHRFINSWYILYHHDSILADCIGCIFNVCFFRTSPTVQKKKNKSKKSSKKEKKETKEKKQKRLEKEREKEKKDAEREKTKAEKEVISKGKKASSW